jgi:hypothetical protein
VRLDRGCSSAGTTQPVVAASYSYAVTNNLPNGIPEILQHLAEMARGYDNRLKWNEVAKLKADLMNVPVRWRGVSVIEIADYCRTLGMRDEDVAEVADLVGKAQAGRRLVPQKTYRDFRFNQSVAQPATIPPPAGP